MMTLKEMIKALFVFHVVAVHALGYDILEVSACHFFHFPPLCILFNLCHNS